MITEIFYAITLINVLFIAFLFILGAYRGSEFAETNTAKWVIYNWFIAVLLWFIFLILFISF
jgi:hypothetical protein